MRTGKGRSISFLMSCLLFFAFQIPSQKCREYPIKVPKKIPKEECHTHPREECKKIPKQVPRQVAEKVPKYYCDDKKEAVIDAPSRFGRFFYNIVRGRGGAGGGGGYGHGGGGIHGGGGGHLGGYGGGDYHK